jgi:multiple antibiotic resistance protein
MTANEIIYKFLLVFIPVFVAIDIIGILPLFLSLIENIRGEGRTGVVRQSVLTALIVGMGFLFLGRPLFNFLGITGADFKIAGGIILLVLAVTDLLFPGKSRLTFSPEVGIVPIGTPLIVGPAVLTTLVLMVDIYGYFLTCISLVINLVLVWLVLTFSEKIYSILGSGGTRAFGKVLSLLLAAIAVMMIRVGISEFFNL